MTNAVIDLAQLPAPSVVEPLDFEAILAAHRADLLARHPDAADVLALESEPLTKLLQSHAFRELLYRQRVNEAARAYLLAYAAGADLDHKGAFYGVPRLPGEPDERLRQRIQLRVRALAGNGTREAYEFTALTASLQVRATRASQPNPGTVLVLVWPHAGADAPATLAAVTTALLQDGAHTLGVTVLTALARAHPIDVTASITREPLAPADLLTRLAAALPALIDEHASLGRDLPRSWLTARLHGVGVAGVSYPNPAQPAELTVLAPDEYPVAGAINLIDGGVAS